MKTIAEWRKDYDYFSGQLSLITRQLDFAGIAVVWLLRVGEDVGPVSFAPCLLVALFAFVLSLVFDLLHYAYGSVAWGWFARHHERKHGRLDVEVGASPKMNWPTLVFFGGKALACSVGHVILLSHMARELLASE